MKKVFCAMAFVAALVSFGSVKANDINDAYNESLIKYRYEKSSGQKTFDQVPVFRHLTPSVRSQSNVCWWDYNEWFNCKASDRETK